LAIAGRRLSPRTSGDGLLKNLCHILALLAWKLAPVTEPTQRRLTCTGERRRVWLAGICASFAGGARRPFASRTDHLPKHALDFVNAKGVVAGEAVVTVRLQAGAFENAINQRSPRELT